MTGIAFAPAVPMAVRMVGTLGRRVVVAGVRICRLRGLRGHVVASMGIGGFRLRRHRVPGVRISLRRGGVAGMRVGFVRRMIRFRVLYRGSLGRGIRRERRSCRQRR